MNISALFIKRPIATVLLTTGLALSGLLALKILPVAPLPQVDFPTISVGASMPGASPEIMAATVAAPLEKRLGIISGVTEMTSTSYLGSAGITLQFDLSRNIDGAARDVQAAINAARADLPTNLLSNPTYRKVNPSDAPIVILALTSDRERPEQVYDAASSIMAQKLMQVQGIGQVVVGGASLPAVRVELNPTALSRYGIGFADVRGAIDSANVTRPIGKLNGSDRLYEIVSNGPLRKAAEYAPLIIAYRHGAPVRLSDVALVRDSVQDLRNMGLVNGKAATPVILFKQPGANIIETIDNVKKVLPNLAAEMPGDVRVTVVMDRSTTIRASLKEVERTLLFSGILVILVVFVFLRNVRATLIPAIAVPVSLIGTFGVMYLLGYSLDNLSLMALTIATGFVVDDAIVVLENISRHRELGKSPVQAAIDGANEVGFTVLSMSTSLCAVFIPILLMGGVLGRLFNEFAVTLSVSILVSMVISLTTTPMMCATIMRPSKPEPKGMHRPDLFERLHNGYAKSLTVALRHRRIMASLTFLAVAATIVLFILVPKGFFPQQDTGRIMGSILASQDISFTEMKKKVQAIGDIIMRDSAVDNAVVFTGGGQTINTGRMFIALKDFGSRKVDADQIIARLRRKLAMVPGAQTYLQSTQDVRVGGRMSGGQYQFTLQGEDLTKLDTWAPQVEKMLHKIPGIEDVSSDEQSHGLSTQLTIDRPTASRLGITPALIDETLYDAFGQRAISIIYTGLNQYRVVMEVESKFWQRPSALREIYVRTPDSTQVPMAAFSKFEVLPALLAVNHHAQFPAVTLSFNLGEKASLGKAVAAITAAMRSTVMPGGMRSSFAGTAQAFQASLENEPLLILAALLAVYIVLGILYESYLHPLTILSTLPSAGVGAFLAMIVTGTQFDILSLVGCLLLIGLVKKNGILIVDFALQGQRNEGLTPRDAIYRASLLRFRPIMMTTMAALFAAVPLAVMKGTGYELRRPLGIAIIGGLMLSQVMTLYTTPVIYLYIDRLRNRMKRKKQK
jgi:multidrug efflux pump